MQQTAAGKKMRSVGESQNAAIPEGPDGPGNHAFIGCDVGDRNFDSSPHRRDALVVLNHAALYFCQPNRDKLRNSIKDAASRDAFLSALMARQMVGSLVASAESQALDLGTQDTLLVDVNRNLGSVKCMLGPDRRARQSARD